MFVLKDVKFKNILNIRELVLPEGKVTCIVGESGSGKTTLLRLLNNMITCDQGSIFFQNKSIYEIDPVELRRKVVMLPQNPAIFQGTVKDNLLIGLKFAEKPLVDDKRLQEVLEQVHLKKEFSAEAKDLSGGEKQRLALGRVLLLEPEVFLLDEPSSALDEDTELLVMEKLVANAKAKGKTLIMVTHSRKIARMYGEEIIEVRNGQAFGAKGV